MASTRTLAGLILGLAFFIQSQFLIHHGASMHRLQFLRPQTRHSKFSKSYSNGWSTAFFRQSLDHFSFTNSSYDRFDQKYLTWSQVWAGQDANAPIFVYCGNEGPIEWFVENAGYIKELAAIFGALVVAPEHRYYGESMPFGSFQKAYKDAESLAYLTTEQAIADYAVLLTDLKKNLSAESSPIVLFGGSYGGMIAAWFRLKYPHVAIGAVASSAPILQFGDVVPSDTFYRIASQDYKRESESCFETIRDSWDVISAVGSTPGGLDSLSKKFRLCRPLSDASDLSDWLDSAYSYLAMVDYPIAADFLMPLPAFPVRELCKAVDSLPEGSDILDRIFKGASLYYNYSGTVNCFDINEDVHGMGGWDYQYCTEMLMPFSSNASNSMFRLFDWNVTAQVDSCLEQYGVRPRPDWVLTQFGGKNIKQVLKHFGSNILFLNGALDPWSGGGVLEDINPTILASVIPDGGHHLDLRASTPNDPISVVRQRKFEADQIRKWLKEYYRDLQSSPEQKSADPRTSSSAHGSGSLLLLAAGIAIIAAVVYIRRRSKSLREPLLNPFSDDLGQDYAPMSSFPGFREFRLQKLTMPAVLAILLLPLAAMAETEGHLPVDLVFSTFNSTLSAAPTPWALVEFYASWCPTCQHFKPHFEKVASLFMGPDAAYPDLIYFARVDCATEVALCGRFDVDRYPTMFLGSPSVLGTGSRAGQVLPEGVVHLEVRFEAGSVLQWISHHFNREFSFSALLEGSASKSAQSPNVTLPTHASIHDIVEATALSFKYILQNIKRHPESREPMKQWLQFMATYHPAQSCREGSTDLLSMFDSFWPEASEPGLAASSAIYFKRRHICGLHFPSNSWVDCKGSTPEARGYSCGLWSLFHSLAARVDDSHAAELLTVIRRFVSHFFGCIECRGHFLAMAAQLEIHRPDTQKEAVLWLWRAHNQVNARLAVEERDSTNPRGDPLYPKVQWPPAKLCPDCPKEEHAEGVWEEDHVLRFLFQYYGFAKEGRVEAVDGARVEKLLPPAVGPDYGIWRWIFVALAVAAAMGLVVLQWRKMYRNKRSPGGVGCQGDLPFLLGIGARGLIVKHR